MTRIRRHLRIVTIVMTRIRGYPHIVTIVMTWIRGYPRIVTIIMTHLHGFSLIVTIHKTPRAIYASFFVFLQDHCAEKKAHGPAQRLYNGTNTLSDPQVRTFCYGLRTKSYQWSGAASGNGLKVRAFYPELRIRGDRQSNLIPGSGLQTRILLFRA